MTIMSTSEITQDQFCKPDSSSGGKQYLDITSLPYDILVNVLTRLNTQELIAASWVCRSWRTRILDCHEAFSTLILFEGGTETDRRELRQLLSRPSVQDAMQELYIRMMYSQLDQNLVLFTTNCRFPRLKKLHIRGKKKHHVDILDNLRAELEYAMENDDSLIRALRNVSDTLSDLLISTRRSTVTPFDIIFSTCPNLRVFTYDQDIYPRNPILSSHLSTQLTGLNELNLKFQFGHIAKDMIKDTIRCSPQLVKLTLDFYGIDMVETIHRHCKKLESLHVRDVLRYSGNRRAKDGVLELVTFVVRAIPECAYTMTPYLRQGAHTLRSLDLRLQSTRITRSWDELLMIAFPKLISLALSSSDLSDSAFPAILIAHLPNLRHVYFKNCKSIPSSVLDEVAKLNHLESLTMSHASLRSKNAIYNMLRAFANKRCLKSVAIDNCSFTKLDYLLNSLAAVGSLEEISIQLCKLASKEAMDRFCERLQNHLSIRVITFRGLRVVTDSALCQLSAVETLERLNLIQMDHVTEQGISDFRNSRPEVVLKVSHRL